MKKQANRKAILVSAVLTAILLTFAGSGALLVNRFFAQPAEAQTSAAALPQPARPSASEPAAAATGATTTTADAQTIAAYKAQLEQAYRDLNDAYAQVQALQAAQMQPSRPSFFEDDEHEREEAFQRGSVIILQPRGFDND